MTIATATSPPVQSQPSSLLDNGPTAVLPYTTAQVFADWLS
jgi:hypothetical protein